MRRRELRRAEHFSLAATHPERIGIPALLLHGADSPPFFIEPMAKLKRAISGATAMPLDGQQHVAMDTAPDMLASIVTAFWRKVDG